MKPHTHALAVLSNFVRALLFGVMVALVWLYSAASVAAATISYVQGKSATPQSAQTSVSVTFTAAQAAGDLNVVVVGWNNTTSTVSSVADKSGNTYARAVGPTALTGLLTQSIYYAKNIKAAAAGANIVTVTFSASAPYPDIRILEYSGADLNNPVDVTAAATGNSTTTNSGSATTTNATDLIFGASMVGTFTTGPGSGFTSRLLTSPDGDIAEDKMVTTTGSYSATTAALSPGGPWIMQMVAFHTPAATGGTPTAPTNLTATPSGPVQVNLSWTAATETGGTISQYLIERCAGSTCSNFVQVGTSTTTTFSDTSLTGSTSYNYRVRAQDTSNNNGPYSNIASATTAAPTFTAPTNLTATASGPVQVNLSWTAATETGGTISQYLIERCAGSTCTNFVQIGTSASTSFNDTTSGLTGSTAYNYRVRATDASNNLGPYSNTTSATTAAPTFTAPSNLTATASGPVQVNLSWTAATETGGTISQYLIERCAGSTCTNFVQVGTSASTSFNDATSGLTGSTTYNYRVRATDASNNLGPYSNTASATTAAPTFTAPSNLTATAAGSTQINLTWTAATETGGTINQYLIERCSGASCSSFAQVATSASTTFNDSTVLAGTSYSYRVRATDASNNLGPYSNTASAITPVNAPTAPTNLTATASGPVQVNLSWTAATETGGTISQYLIERCAGSTCSNFVQVGTSTTTTFSDTSLTGSTSYNYRVRAQDTSNNDGPYSITASATTAAPTFTAPTNLTGTASGPVQVNLSWTAATETGGTISQYLIERCAGSTCSNFAQIGTSAATTFSDTAVTGSTTYNYRVRATDASNNLGPYSNTASATTAAPTFTAPSNLTATAASSTQINLSWTAATETGGTISQYLIERCTGSTCGNFVQVGTSATTTFSDTGLAASTSYSYRVRATDAANNTSPYSPTATATTAAAATPTAPTNLAFSAGPGPIVQAVQTLYDTTATTSHSTTAFDSTGGDLIVMLGSSHAGVTFTPTDNFGNTWIPIAGPTSTAAGDDLRTEIWYAWSPIVGTGHTVTMGLSSPQALVISIIVVKGSNVSSPIDVMSGIGSDNGTQTVNVASPGITTTGLNDLLIGFLKDAGATFQPGTGWTQQANGLTTFLDAETETAANPGTYNATFTLGQTNTWQSGIVAASNNPNQLRLSWTASTESGGTIGNYLVERCQGSGCTTFAQIGTTATTLFNDTGLAAATSYSYRVRAQDTLNNLGPYSAVVTFTTPPTIPALPGNLTAATASGTQINLSWLASPDSAGPVSNYFVERCLGAGCSNFAQIGTSATTSYSDAGLGGGSFSYRVRAEDATGNLSPYSNVATDVLAAAPPTAPSNLSATTASVSQINLSWTASTSSIGIANYVIQRCQGTSCTNFAQIGTTTSTAYNDTGLSSATNYSYQVEAIDTAGTASAFSNVASATTFSPTGVIGYVQGNFATPQTSQTTVSVTYTSAQAAGDLNVVVVGWNDTTATISSVVDKSGNTYTRAVGPTTVTGVLTQSIYYAKNIKAAAAGANIVTVTFSAAASFADIRILEYTGADINSPVDVTATATGSSTTTNSGSATTTNATDLIFGADMVNTFTTGPGTGFTSRLLTSPDGDIAEDRMVTATGSYNTTTAALSPSGPWIMQMVAFRTPGGGVNAPSAPTNLTATAAGPVQINLSWTAAAETGGTISQYLVERCTGSTCTNFVQVGATASTTFSDTGLTGSTAYSYRVRAQDTIGNLGSYSTTALGTTAAPTFTAPSNLTATAAGSTQISLAWAAATETGGTISQYLIERCTGASCSSFAQVATSASTTFNDSTVVAGTSYSYRVRATDASNNLGPYSNTASATTPVNAPTAPTSLTATASGSTQINLSWTAATETGGTISQYLIERCAGSTCSNFVQVGTSTTTTFSDTSLTGSTSYNYRVRAQDTSNNNGPYSNIASATTAAPTFTAPTNLTATASGPVQVNLSWTAATETGGTISQYLIERCAGSTCTNFVQIGTSASTSFNDTTSGLTGSTTYNYRVRATDASNNLGPYSNTTSATTAAPTFTAPSNLAGTATSTTQISLSWTAATETGGAISQYLIERCAGSSCSNFVQVGSSATTTFSDTGLSGSTSYNYRVRATDAANDLGPYSSVTTVTTQTPQPPSTPTNLTATGVSASQINLAWSASTSNVGLANYVVQRCQGAGCTNFAKIAAPTGTSYSDTGLTASVSYSYQVQAVDTSGTSSAFSNIATAITQNPVIIENQQPGSSNWQIGDYFFEPEGTDSVGQIKGYTSATSVNKGENITFYVSVNPAQTFTIDVYRVGWYQGLGGRLMQHIGPLNGVQQPACPRESGTGKTECQWAASYTLATQTSWTSGIYLVVLSNANGYYNYMVFCVRDDSRVAALLYQQGVNTDNAYNDWGGWDLYTSPQAYKVSFDRPYGEEGSGNFLWLGEMNLVRWLEKNGYDVTYSTDVDTQVNPNMLLNYKGVLIAGHNEYWSKQMYDAVTAARDAGVNLAFFGSNPIYWQIRYESSSSGVANRVVVCYKDATLDPTTDPTLTTVNWRDPILNRPEQVVIGVQYTSQPNANQVTYVVTNSSNWVYAGTGFKDGDTVAGIVGYEADRLFSEYPAPNAVAGTYTLLSHSPYPDKSNNPDYQNSSIYQAPSGAWVFASGTMAWTWALDDFYPDGYQLPYVDARIQQTTANILNQFVSH